MGEVYRARDTRLDRSVAIKILPTHLFSDPVRKQRFEREAKTISSLNHLHICVLHDVGSQDGVDYLVIECVEGEAFYGANGEFDVSPDVQHFLFIKARQQNALPGEVRVVLNWSEGLKSLVPTSQQP